MLEQLFKNISFLMHVAFQFKGKLKISIRYLEFFCVRYIKSCYCFDLNELQS